MLEDVQGLLCGVETRGSPPVRDMHEVEEAGYAAPGTFYPPSSSDYLEEEREGGRGDVLEAHGGLRAGPALPLELCPGPFPPPAEPAPLGGSPAACRSAFRLMTHRGASASQSLHLLRDE